MGFRPGLFRLAFFAGWKFSITGPEQRPLLDPEYFPRLQFLSHRHPRYENFPSWPYLGGQTPIYLGSYGLPPVTENCFEDAGREFCILCRSPQTLSYF